MTVTQLKGLKKGDTVLLPLPYNYFNLLSERFPVYKTIELKVLDIQSIKACSIEDMGEQKEYVILKLDTSRLSERDKEHFEMEYGVALTKYLYTEHDANPDRFSGYFKFDTKALSAREDSVMLSQGVVLQRLNINMGIQEKMVRHLNAESLSRHTNLIRIINLQHARFEEMVRTGKATTKQVSIEDGYIVIDGVEFKMGVKEYLSRKETKDELRFVKNNHSISKDLTSFIPNHFKKHFENPVEIKEETNG